MQEQMQGISEEQRAAVESRTDPPLVASAWLRWLLIAAGSISSALGLVGVFLPLVPTTPFLLLAAACFVRSSPTLHRALVTNRLFGRYLDDYLSGRGIPWRVKFRALVLMWVLLGYSGIFLIQILWVRLLLVVVGVGVTAHLALVKTRQE